MKNKFQSFLFCLVLLSGTLEAQTLPKYLVLFKDKAGSSYDISRPESFLSERSILRRQKQGIPIHLSDLPVNNTYLAQLKEKGATVSLVTKWFNGAVVEVTEQQLTSIKELPFVKAVERDRPLNNRSENQYITRSREVVPNASQHATLDAGAMQEQLDLLGIPDLTKEGIDARNQLIAVFDAGFYRVNELPYFTHLFSEKRVIDTWDFISETPNVYQQHTHGTQVLSTIAAFDQGKLVGAAPKAQFALYRTEIGSSETPLEEITWLCAAERADSLGVDVINSSLGYNTFDYHADNYSYAQMDGQTSMIARAARWAVRKGILVVNSVGNEGNSSWRHMVSPADVDSVLAVGGIDFSMNRASFSSIGPTSTGVIKPDVVTLGVGVVVGSTSLQGNSTTSQGTSFAAPQIAGFAALLWHKYPSLKVMDLVNLLRKSGSQSLAPDVNVGYGLPTYQRAKEVYETEYLVTATTPIDDRQVVLYPNPVQDYFYLDDPSLLKKDLYRLEIVNMKGESQHIQSTLFENGFRIKTDHLEEGVYILKIISSLSTPITIKFLKVN